LDYEKSVISVRTGKLLAKESKDWVYQQNNRLCVEEPFNTIRNLGNTADDCSMRGIHLEFRRAHRLLAEKGDLAGCCELFEYPPEEIHPLPPPPVPSRPVTLSRSNSNHRSRNNGYSAGGQRGGGQGGGRFQYNNHKRNLNQSRRGSNGAAFNQNVIQQQQQQQQQQHSYYPAEMFGYVPTTQEQLVLIQAQIQAHAHAQAQLIYAAQAQVHAQLHSQQQSGSQSQTNGTSPSREVNPFFTWPYITQLYGLNQFYNGFPLGHSAAGSDVPTVAGSPPRTPAAMTEGVNGNRLGSGRVGRRNGYTNGSRSQSQPPPLYPTNGYGRSMPIGGVASSEDDDFADHSSNSNQPETPPEEEYIGYYTIGQALQSDLAVVVGEDEQETEETFLEPKTVVDRHKRGSNERLPAPLLGLPRGTPPGPTGRRGVALNGSLSHPFVAPNHGELVFPFDAGAAVNGVNDVNGTSTRNDVKGQVHAHKLLEVHNQQSDATLRGSSRQHNQPSASHQSAASPATMSTLDDSNLEGGEAESLDRPRMSPSMRQRAAAQQLLRSHGSKQQSPTKGTSQEDLTLSPVAEVPTPPPQTSARRGQDSKSSLDATKREEKPVVNGNGGSKKQKVSSNTKDDPVPPTPAPEKSGQQQQRNGNARSRGDGNNKSTLIKGKKEPTESKVEAKAGEANGAGTATGGTAKATWVVRKHKPKKKRTFPNVREVAAKDAERKGG